MTATEPWQTAEIAGPKKALVITKPEVVTELIGRARRKILIVGHRVSEKEPNGYLPLGDIVGISEAGRIPIVATGIAANAFKNLSTPVHQMSAVEIVGRISDPHWRGLDGNGSYDLVLFTGFAFYVEWLMLSTLKHFSRNILSVSLNRYYQPNASWSFSNISVDDWRRNMNTIASELRSE